MSKDVFEYRGYCGSIEHDLDGDNLFGSIQFINDILVYEASTLRELRQAFQESVDEYLDTCKEIGKDPDKAYSGTFNIRVSPEVHRKIAHKALKEGLSLNACISIALEGFVSPTEIVHKHEHNYSFFAQIPFENKPSVDPTPQLRLVQS